EFVALAGGVAGFFEFAAFNEEQCRADVGGGEDVAVALNRADDAFGFQFVQGGEQGGTDALLDRVHRLVGGIRFSSYQVMKFQEWGSSGVWFAEVRFCMCSRELRSPPLIRAFSLRQKEKLIAFMRSS